MNGKKMGRGFSICLALVLAVGLVSPPGGAEAQEPIQGVNFLVRPLLDEIHGFGWDVGTTVNLQVEDEWGGVLYSTPGSVEAGEPGAPYASIVRFELNGIFDILPQEHFIKLNNFPGTGYKVGALTLAPLAAGDAILTGTADRAEGETIDVYMNTWGASGSYETTINEDGSWQVLLDTPLAPGDEVDVHQCLSYPQDLSTACTSQLRWVPDPWFLAAVGEDYLDAWDWPQGALVTTVVDSDIDPGNGVDCTRSGIADFTDWSPVNTVVEFELPAGCLTEGDFVTVSGGGVTESHAMALRITAVDSAHDQIRGWADPNETASVLVRVRPAGTADRWVTPDAVTGEWVASFSDPLDGLPDYDIGAGSKGVARVDYSDGNTTRVWWGVPTPHPFFIARLEGDRLWLGGNNVSTGPWLTGTQLRLVIDDNDNPEDGLLYEDFGMAEPVDGQNVALGDCEFAIAGYTLKPGDHVSVSGGGFVKDLIFPHLAVTTIDVGADVIRGTLDANDGRPILLRVQPAVIADRRVLADSAGNWEADFSQPGPNPGEEQSYDLKLEDAGSVSTQDGDGDWTTQPWPLKAMGQLDEQGGLISTPSVNMLVPPGALASPATFTIAEGGAGYALGTNQGQADVVFTAAITPHGTTFNTPVTVTLGWSDADGDGIVDYTTLGEGDLRIIKDGVVITPRCAEAGGACNASSNTYSVQVTSLSSFVLGVLSNRPPAISAVLAPTHPVPIGQAVEATVMFADPDSGDVHTVDWDWGDGVITNGAATESHTYAAPGVYTISVTVTDAAGASVTGTSEFVVIYDPEGGFVTGGGWIDSPAGAYASDATLTGKATFGFVSKYLKGANVPSGSTEFQFKAADLNFKSTSYDWLVVAGARAQFKGVGTINGAGEYAFMLTATDGEMSGGGGIDLFRIKIWDRSTGQVVYDNQLGAPDGADPTTALQGGSIVIHK